MALFRIIPAGDIDIVAGKIVILRGPAYVRQKLSTRLKFWLSEWFLDLREGVPYYRDVFVKNPDLELVRTVFRQVILSVQEVASVPMLQLDYDERARSLAPEFDAVLVEGGVLEIRQPDPAFIISVQRSPD